MGFKYRILVVDDEPRSAKYPKSSSSRKGMKSGLLGMVLRRWWSYGAPCRMSLSLI